MTGQKSRAHAEPGKLKVKLRTTKKDYLAAVARTKEYITAGDIFQAVLSQRFDVEPGTDSFQVYRALRTVNPSPYMYFLRFAPDGPLGALPPKRGKSLQTKILPVAPAQTIETCRVVAGVAGARPPGQGGSTGPSPETRPRGATKTKTRPWPTKCSRTKRSAPSTSCWSILAATTLAVSASTAASK